MTRKRKPKVRKVKAWGIKNRRGKLVFVGHPDWTRDTTKSQMRPTETLVRLTILVPT